MHQKCFYCKKRPNEFKCKERSYFHEQFENSGTSR